VTTRLVVLSDTHLPRPGRVLPTALLDALSGADGVVHLGDFTRSQVADFLESFGPLYAVFGNNDCVSLRRRFAERERLTIEGHRITLIHGHLGGPTAKVAARRVERAEIVLYGHSHRPENTTEHGVLYFNPGSPTDRRWFPYPSFGMLYLEPESVRAEIIPIGSAPIE